MERVKASSFNCNIGCRTNKIHSAKQFNSSNDGKACKIELKYFPVRFTTFLYVFISNLQLTHKLSSLAYD